MANANEQRKSALVKALSDEALNEILDNLRGPELRDASPEYPLGGLVHITGIGQVSVKRLRAERERRAAL